MRFYKLNRLAVVTIGLLFSPSSMAQERVEICDEVTNGVLPYDNHIRGEIDIGDGEIRSNLVIAGGHTTDYFKQCVFTEGSEFGWTWDKGDIDPACAVPGQCRLPNAVCGALHQLTVMGHHQGITPWGEGQAVPGLPAEIDKLDSLVVTLPLTFTAVDEAPASPNVFYNRYGMIIDIFRTSEKPVVGTSVSDTLTDEIVIFMNYNPEIGASCNEEGAETWFDPIVENAVFDGQHYYHYTAWTNQNQVGGVVANFHGFQRVGGNRPGSMPTQINLIPFFEFMDTLWGSGAGNWLGDIMIGTEVREHTNGSVVFNAVPAYTFVNKPPPCSGCGCPAP